MKKDYTYWIMMAVLFGILMFVVWDEFDTRSSIPECSKIVNFCVSEECSQNREICLEQMVENSRINKFLRGFNETD